MPNGGRDILCRGRLFVVVVVPVAEVLGHATPKILGNTAKAAPLGMGPVIRSGVERKLGRLALRSPTEGAGTTSGLVETAKQENAWLRVGLLLWQVSLV